MTAKEIRENAQACIMANALPACNLGEGTVNRDDAVVFFLAELAAQLADLNAVLDGFSVNVYQADDWNVNAREDKRER